ncbi:MAG: hypothetical protein PHY59_04325 [Methanobacterium sp.]|nr:hypothetical protein [Methanobacterium sp.]
MKASKDTQLWLQSHLNRHISHVQHREPHIHPTTKTIHHHDIQYQPSKTHK